jgi:hypothetical protein
MLKKFGKNMALKSVVTAIYETATASASQVVTSYSIKAYLGRPNKTELVSGQIVASDEVAIFAALGLAVEPKLNDLIIVDGRDRLVKMVSRTWSGEQVALWRVGLAS